MRSRGKNFIGLILAVGFLTAWILCLRQRPALSSMRTERATANLNSNAPSSASSAVKSPALLTAPSSLDALVGVIVAKLQAWDDDDNPELRAQRLQELDALLSGPHMFEIVGALPPKLMGYAFALPSFRNALMVNPAATLDWLLAHQNISQSHVLSFLQDWEQKDPTAMEQSLTALPTGEWKQNVLATAANETLSRDPLAAIVWARQMNPGAAQTMLLQMATTEWAKTDPQAAAQWAQQIGDPALRDQLYASLAVGNAEMDPVAAAGWLVQSLSPGTLLDKSAAQVAGTWAMQDAAAAAQWVADFPAGAARQQALSAVINVWGNHDPKSVTAWVANLPAGSLRTEATQLLAGLPAAQ